VGTTNHHSSANRLFADEAAGGDTQTVPGAIGLGGRVQPGSFGVFASKQDAPLNRRFLPWLFITSPGLIDFAVSSKEPATNHLPALH
jgi:hypothetical protein